MNILKSTEFYTYIYKMNFMVWTLQYGSLVAQMAEEPLEKGMATTPILPGEFHGQRSL